MNLLMLTHNFPPKQGGISRFSYELAKEFVDKNEIGNFWVAGWNDFAENESRINYLKVPKFHLKSFKVIKVVYKLYNFIKKNNIDKILCTCWNPFGIVGFLLKKILDVDLYLVSHGQEILIGKKDFGKQGVLYKFKELSFQSADKVFAVSSYTKRLLLEQVEINENKVEVILNGVNYKKLNKERKRNISSTEVKFDINDKDKIILTVSRLVKRKGHMKVIEAIDKLKNEFPHLKYYIVGSGPEKENINGKVKELGLENNVFLTGYLSDSEIYDMYKLCDIFIMVNQELLENNSVEGFGLVFLEANTFKKPVIGGNNGGVPDAIIDGETGFLVDEENTAEIANKIKKLIENEELAREMGEKGYYRVKNSLNWRAQADKYIKIMLSNSSKQTRK